MKNSPLKQHIEMFLMKYKNHKTWWTYRQVFKIIENLNAIDIKTIIEHAKKVIKILPWRSETKNHRATIIKTFCNRLAITTFQNNAIYYIKEWEQYEMGPLLRLLLVNKKKQLLRRL